MVLFGHVSGCPVGVGGGHGDFVAVGGCEGWKEGDGEGEEEGEW